MKKYLSVFMVIVILLTLASPIQYVSAANSTRLNRFSVVVGFNETVQLKILDIPKEYKSASIKWSSENNKIANVDKNGLVTGISKGKTKINAVVGKKTLTCLVTIMASSRNIADALKKIQADFYEGNTIDCILTNKTNIDLVFDCKITFYKDGSPVSINKIPSFIFANNKQVVSFRKTDKEYDSYKIEFLKANMLVPKNVSAKVPVTVITEAYDYYPNKGDSSVKEKINLINLSLINSTDDFVNLNAYVVYYKDNKIVYGQSFSDSNVLNIGSDTIYNPLVAWLYRTNQEPSTTTNIPDYDNYELIYNAFKY